MRVQDRKIAMVYQQFINYPSMSVYDNIATPLRIMKKDEAFIDQEVRKTAKLMRLDNILDRKPLELSGGQQASNIIDIKSKELNLKPKFSVKAEFINSRLGSDLSLESIKSILENVEIGIEIDDSNLIIQPPFWRMDLELPEDIVEEVGRLYGYDKLPVELPKRVMNPTQTDSLIDLKNIIREHLASNGANELMTYSFVHGDLLNKVGQNSELALELGNAISPSLQFYRISVLPNLLEKIHPNIKAGYEEFSLFEMGKVHSKKYIGEDGLPIEQERLALVFSANSKKAKNYSGSAYFIAKNYLNSLANKLGLGLKFVSFDSLSTSSFDQQIATSFSPKRSAVALTLDNQFVGVIGEFKPEVSSGLKLPEYTAGFELDIKALLNNFKNQTNYRIQSKYPKVDQDITLKVDQDISYSELLTNFEMALGKLLPENTSASVVPLDIYQAEGENTKNISFRLSISSFNETLKAETVNSLLDSVAEEISVERI